MAAMFSFLRDRHAKASQNQQNSPKRASGSGREVLMFKNREVHVRRKPYKRSIGLTLQVNGRIRVSAPNSTPLSNIIDFLQANAEWIDMHLRKYESLRQAHPPKRYSEGEKFLFLGHELPLHFVRGYFPTVQFEVLNGALLAHVPPAVWDAGFDPFASHPEVALSLTKFYAEQGRFVLGERIACFAERMNLRPRRVVFRSQKTRWGSCSASGLISLNWRLIIAPLDVIDYVVVHELSHLQHYNHSARFWNLVGTQIPRYLELRNWLRTNQYKADFLAKRSELHQ